MGTATDSPSEPREWVGESAGALCTMEIPIVRPTDTVEEAWASLRGRSFRAASHLAVVDGEHLAGVAALEDVLSADAGASVLSVARPPTTVGPDVDQEVAVWRAARDSQAAIAVVDETDRFLGLVPARAMLRVLEHEHEEDLARLGGYLHDTESARRASFESVQRRLWHRLPWLLMGLAAAMVAAAIVSGFERDLSENIALAFFLPGVVYLADAVGTQTETLVIRGLSVGVDIRQVIVRELLTGLLIGFALLVAFLPVAWLWQGPDVALTVALALLAASSVATGLAMILPSIFARYGVDPAFGSGPLATVAQDLLTITIYLALARWLLS